MATVKHFKMVIRDFKNVSNWPNGPKKPFLTLSKDGKGADFDNYLTDIANGIGNLNSYSAGESISMTIQIFNEEE